MKTDRRAFASFVCPLLMSTMGLFSMPQAVTADSPDRLLRNLSGSYAYLFTGTVFLPPPFDAFNGPFFRMGQIVSDGKGNLMVSYVGNFNGAVSKGTFAATYVFTSDTTFTLIIPNAPIPGIPTSIPTLLTMDGVLADGGKIAKCVLSGVSIAGQVPPNIGSVISGDLIKQSGQD
jgi:hypothetical protein